MNYYRTLIRTHYNWEKARLSSIFFFIIIWLTAMSLKAQDCQISTTVSTYNDAGPGSLRHAVANIEAGGIIYFSDNMPADTLRLTAGEILIDKPLTIVGPSQGNLSIDGGGASRVFRIIGDNKVEIRNLFIQNGSANRGGGIWNEGDLCLQNCVLYNNRAFPASGVEGEGGAIYHAGGNLQMMNCYLFRNTASIRGGGIFLNAGNLSISMSRIERNTGSYPGAEGGGIYCRAGDVQISHTTINDNYTSGSPASSAGGGLFNYGSVIEISNSTFYENKADARGNGNGGALYNFTEGELSLNHCTITKNSPGGQNPGGGGIHNLGTIHMQNSIVAENFPAYMGKSPDVFNSGTFISEGYNLLGYNSIGLIAAEGDLLGDPEAPIDPELGAFGDYGGYNLVVMPKGGSPAINGGNPASSINTDQRKFERPAGDRVDIGAVEFGASFPPCIVTTLADDGPGSLRDVVKGAIPACTIRFDEALAGGTIFLQTGEIVIDKPLSITGLGMEETIISGACSSRIFSIKASLDDTVRLTDLTIKNGLGDSIVDGLYQGGGIWNNAVLYLDHCKVEGNRMDASFVLQGGGIFSEGSLFVNHSIVQNNSMRSITGSAHGGGIYASGNVELNSSLIQDNFAAGGGSCSGGGVFYNAPEPHSLYINLSTIQNNGAGGGAGNDCGSGGGIYVQEGNVEINLSTINDNTAKGYGGGIDNQGGNVDILVSTISGNSAGAIGGGIQNAYTMTINGATLAQNKVLGQGIPLRAKGGGVFNTNQLTLVNCILATNTNEAPANLNDGYPDGYNDGTMAISYSLVGINDFGLVLDETNLAGTDTAPLNPQLGPLTDNGGPTFTHALLAASPAIDMGSPDGGLFPHDQRLLPSPINGRLDIGSFEYGSSVIASFTLIDPVTDTEMGEIEDGAILDLSQFTEGRINIRANIVPATVGSVVFDLNEDDAFHIENVAPYAFAGDGAGDYNDWWQPAPGEYTIGATAYTEAGGAGVAGIGSSVSFTVIEGVYDAVVESFTIIDPVTDMEMGMLKDGDVINMALFSSASLNIRANTHPETVGSVVFGLNEDDDFHIENSPPYAFAGDGAGDYNDWWMPEGGTYTITATPYAESSGDGLVGSNLSVSFTVIEASARKGRINESIYDIEIFPNPTKAGIYLRSRMEGVASIRVIDMTGREMMQAEWINSDRIFIDLSSLPDGIYFVELAQKDQRIIRKVMKQ